MFRRKIYDVLKEWKDRDKGRTAILLEGARRVGKSTIVEEFARNEYSSYILIDFSNVEQGILNMFNEGTPDLDSLLLNISTAYGVKLHERNSLIIFDEVQFCPKARQKIKHLVKDGRYDYIETGSLISIKKNVEDILIPSEEKHLMLHPMDFEEFLWAMGDETLMPYLRESYRTLKPIDETIHRKAMNLFKKYMIVGGMPEVVSAFVSNPSTFYDMDSMKESIIDLYMADCGKAPNSNGNAARIFRSVPGLLNKHDKTFSPGFVKNGSSVEKLGNPLEWLRESKMVTVCESCGEPTVALGLTADVNRFKLYMSDTGLLSSLAFRTGTADKDEFYHNVLSDRLHINQGMLVENVVAQMLYANGFDLYYWWHRSNEKSYEVDFLISNGRKVIPIEVKSTKNTRHASLDLLLSKYGSNTDKGVILSPKNIKSEDGVTYLPLYMAGLIGT